MLIPSIARRLSLLLAVSVSALGAVPLEYSGIYPHLAMFNDEGECGTGAVVPWAGRLWVVTYAPHKPSGSSDKLYEITAGDLKQMVRPESIGGTPANRMIHSESKQLFIGPYAIGADGKVRVIPYEQMFGRPTGNARHLTDPASKILYATMEEGIYEVDVHTLAVKELWADEQRSEGRHADLPGYHGKGFYSGQGRVIYANNGDHAKEALTDPTTPSGALAEWDGQAAKWEIVRRNQFTEVTGSGGIFGAEHPETDPIWTIGWDFRSLILMLREGGKWETLRLPKASHAYDGAHGWNTEWPRIREIGDGHFLMTMHGTFWEFPPTLSQANLAGLAPRSNYLKVIGDFARWGENVVFGCDDAAKSEFLNKRRVKGSLLGPGQSQSNLWFVPPEKLDHLGPAIGTGAVWLDEAVKAGTPSDRFMFSGYQRRGLHLATGTDEPVLVTMEITAREGSVRSRPVEVRRYAWIPFAPGEVGTTIRLSTDRDLEHVSAVFEYSNEDHRPARADPLFSGLAEIGTKDYSAGVLLTRGANLKTLGFAATLVEDGKTIGEGYYELDREMKLRRSDDADAFRWVKTGAAIPAGVLTTDEASVLVVDDSNRRWRLPKNPEYDNEGPVLRRVCREVCTERDLFQARGTFYELPAENAGGFSKMRAVATHGFNIADYASYRGLLLISGVAKEAADSPHLIHSEDGKCALWAGAVDDLWQIGKPRGRGGPWLKSAVRAAAPSDPYLMRGYDRKQLVVAQESPASVTFRVEVDISGSGQWESMREITCPQGKQVSYEFPAGFSAYWVRFRCDADCEASAQLRYD